MNALPIEDQKALADIASRTGCEITVVIPDEPRLVGKVWTTHRCMIFRPNCIEEADGFIHEHRFIARIAFQSIPMDQWRHVHRVRQSTAHDGRRKVSRD